MRGAEGERGRRGEEKAKILGAALCFKTSVFQPSGEKRQEEVGWLFLPPPHPPPIAKAFGGGEGGLGERAAAGEAEVRKEREGKLGEGTEGGNPSAGGGGGRAAGTLAPNRNPRWQRGPWDVVGTLLLKTRGGVPGEPKKKRGPKKIPGFPGLA